MLGQRSESEILFQESASMARRKVRQFAKRRVSVFQVEIPGLESKGVAPDDVTMEFLCQIFNPGQELFAQALPSFLCMNPETLQIHSAEVANRKQAGSQFLVF